MKRLLLIMCLLVAYATNELKAQQLEKLVVEKVKVDQREHITKECSHLENVVVIIFSSIDLYFESNVDNLKVDHRSSEGMYILCHPKEPYMLSISGPKFKTEVIELFDMKNTFHAYRVTSDATKGQLQISTTPGGAEVRFKDNPNLGFPTGEPITMNSGLYKISVLKDGYLPVDTTVLIPSDGISKLSLVMVPEFSTIKLDVLPSDLTNFQVYPTIVIDSAEIDMNDLLDNRTKIKSFNEKVISYYKLYEGGFVPVPSGTHSIRVVAPGFKNYSSILRTAPSITTPLVVRLEPINGYLTVISGDINANGASILVDGAEIGKVPLFKFKVRTGVHNLKLVKDGFVPSKEEYEIEINDNENTDFTAQMSIFRQMFVVSEPLHAEVLLNDQRKGFTPLTLDLPEGSHNIVVRMAGHSDKKIMKTINVSSPHGVDTLNCKLQQNFPLKIGSELKQARIELIDSEGVKFAENSFAPAEVNIPYGIYTLNMYDEKNRKGFSCRVKHDGNAVLKTPFYSRGTFSVLNADYYPSELKAENKDLVRGSGEYSLLAAASFGRFSIVRGLSTSIAHASMFSSLLDKEEREKDSIPQYMFALSPMFLNGELRLGGGISKNLDLSALGTYYFYPKLEGILSMNHVSGSDIFIGIELSTRISYFNVNVKFGQKIFTGNYHFHNEDSNGDAENGSIRNKFDTRKFEISKTVLSIGFVLGEHKTRSNNMFRLWRKPLISKY